MLLNNPLASFKSLEQAQATMALAETLDDIIVILPTGGGKTVTYSIAPSIEDSLVTIVLYPLTSEYGFDHRPVYIGFVGHGQKAEIWEQRVPVLQIT